MTNQSKPLSSTVLLNWNHSKPWAARTDIAMQLQARERRPQPRRSSLLFPDEKVSPEKSQACARCPQPQLWSMFDGWTAELVASSEEDFVRIAPNLANNPDRLRAWRKGMRNRLARSPLCDAPGFTAEFEELLIRPVTAAP